MANKSGKGKGQQKRVTAIRSAGNQTTGNCNKQMLAAEHRRTDEPHGRLNKQNPVSPQNRTADKSKDGTKQNAGKYEFELIAVKVSLRMLAKAAVNLIDKGHIGLGRQIDILWHTLKGVHKKIDELK